MKKLTLMIYAALISATLLTITPTMSMELAMVPPSLNDLVLHYTATHLRKTNYKQLQPTVLTLVHACANLRPLAFRQIKNNFTTIGSLLLEHATQQSDEQLVTALLEHNVDANALSQTKKPIFFYAATSPILQIFLNHKVNIYATVPASSIPEDKTNVLHEVVHHKYPANLLFFYIYQGVNGKNISSYDKSCLLHRLATLSQTCKPQHRENFFKKCHLIILHFYDMINTPNNLQQTPYDMIKKILHLENTYTPQVNKHRQKHQKEPIQNHRLEVTKTLTDIYRITRNTYLFMQTLAAIQREMHAITNNEYTAEQSLATIDEKINRVNENKCLIEHTLTTIHNRVNKISMNEELKKYILITLSDAINKIVENDYLVIKALNMVDEKITTLCKKLDETNTND